MEWSDIRVFLQVARHGAMARATEALQMDHSTISRRIARLERETGVPLFERAGRRLTLTDAGDKLVAAAEKLEAIIVRDILCLSEQVTRIAGVVRIGAVTDFGAHYLARRVLGLMADHPGLEIELLPTSRLPSLAAREVDFIVTAERPTHGDIRFRKLTDLELGVFAARSFFDGRRKPQRFEDLKDEPWCALTDRTGSDADDGATDQGASIRFRTSSVTAQLQAVLGGHAIAILPCFVAADHPELERLFPEEVTLQRS